MTAGAAFARLAGTFSPAFSPYPVHLCGKERMHEGAGMAGTPDDNPVRLWAVDAIQLKKSEIGSRQEKIRTKELVARTQTISQLFAVTI
jgi:hypothetical protein